MKKSNFLGRLFIAIIVGLVIFTSIYNSKLTNSTTIVNNERTKQSNDGLINNNNTTISIYTPIEVDEKAFNEQEKLLITNNDNIDRKNTKIISIVRVIIAVLTVIFSYLVQHIHTRELKRETINNGRPTFYNSTWGVHNIPSFYYKYPEHIRNIVSMMTIILFIATIVLFFDEIKKLWPF